jgi:uncharacterized cupin superfamily protein
MADPNLFATTWDLDATDSPMHGRAVRVGAAAGSQELGATVYELDPGGAVSPYHLHHGNEELLCVLSGTPSVRTVEGVRELEPGAVVAFPRGRDGAHRVFNASSEVARVLLVSTMRYPEVAEHVTTGTVMAMIGPGDGHVFPAGTDLPFMQLYLEAMKADAEGTSTS